MVKTILSIEDLLIGDKLNWGAVVAVEKSIFRGLAIIGGEYNEVSLLAGEFKKRTDNKYPVIIDEKETEQMANCYVVYMNKIQLKEINTLAQPA